MSGMDLAAERLEATRVRLAARFGDGIAAWWEALPALVARLAERWALRVHEPVGRGGTSLVLRCEAAGGRRAVLKLTPEPALAEAEAAALRLWAPSRRVPELWAEDASAGALLLEAIRSETPPEPSDRHDVAGLIRALHVADPAGVPPLAERVEFVFAHWRERALDVETFDRGLTLARALAVDAPSRVLLHGDLHPGNVLDGGPGRGLVAIDPRPCAGDPAFDAVDWVFWGEPDPARWRPRGEALAAAIGCDPGRLWDWCRAFAPMLAASRARRGAPRGDVEALSALSPS